ncbi:MAG: ABC transporter ATP-binding protein, partial [Candidatus Magasanikbacteria bacterium]|nr:ABC transporter ATP-binding protein [Candidatus Magasanikbacteria bacterium]
EAERVADRIIIIDQGKIILEGTVEKIKEVTGAENLEDAFLMLTGRSIREQEVGAVDNLRMHRKMQRK